MGILKTAAKIAGTAVLVGTGSASAIIKTFADAAGAEPISDLFNSAQDASFNGIRNMWSNGDDRREEYLNDMSSNIDAAARKKIADTAYRAAQTAKKNGDMEKYEKNMEKYYEYK